MPEQTDRQDRLFGVAVALATALAAAFVLWHLGRAPLDRDEVASVTDAHRSLGGTLDGDRLLYVGTGRWDRFGDGGALADGADPGTTDIRALPLGK